MFRFVALVSHLSLFVVCVMGYELYFTSFDTLKLAFYLKLNINVFAPG